MTQTDAKTAIVISMAALIAVIAVAESTVPDEGIANEVKFKLLSTEAAYEAGVYYPQRLELSGPNPVKD
jgi:hypothetical protein